MNRVFTIIGSVTLFVMLVAITGGTRNVAFSAPGLLTVVITFAVCLGGKTKNVFEPIKWSVALYGAAFAILPMLLDPPDLAQYTKSSIHTVQWYLLIYLCLMFVGYKLWLALFPIQKRSCASQHMTASGRRSVTWVASLIFSLGFFGYIYVIVKSGGVAYFLTFKGARPDLFANVHGLFFRLSLWMLSGYALYAAAMIRMQPIKIGIVAIFLGIAYFIFLGRGLAISPIVIFAVLYHYQVKRIKARYIAAGLIAGVFLIAISGIIRSAGKNREELLRNPIVFLNEFKTIAVDRAEHSLLNFVEHLDTLMLIYEHNRTGKPLLKGRTLVFWFEPVDRLLFGNQLIDSISPGHYIVVLRDPRFKKAAYGQWPTIAGELVLNFGLIGAGVCMLIYGACIQWISLPLKSGQISLFQMAIHPYVFYVITRATLAGSTHLLNVLIVAAPVLIASILVGKQSCQIEPDTRPLALEYLVSGHPRYGKRNAAN